MPNPAFLGYHDTIIPTDLLPLRQLLLNLLPRLPQFYFTLNISILHILSAIIFPLKYFPPPDDTNLPLKSILPLQRSPKSNLYAYPTIHEPFLRAPQIHV